MLSAPGWKRGQNVPQLRTIVFEAHCEDKRELDQEEEEVPARLCEGHSILHPGAGPVSKGVTWVGCGLECHAEQKHIASEVRSLGVNPRHPPTLPFPQLCNQSHSPFQALVPLPENWGCIAWL